MKYCVLGGGGSFGLHTSDYLLRQKEVEAVVGIGRSSPKLPCFHLGIGEGDPRYSYQSFHITYEHDLLLEFLDDFKPDVIVNFAAQGESATSLHHCWRYYETNCVGLSKLVEALQSRDYLKRFVHIGTSELYGATDSPATEESPIKPTSPYAISKAAFDMHLIALSRYGFPMNVIRPSNCYDEGQQLHRIIPKTILFGLTGRKIPLHGGGHAKKSYMHNEDLAQAIYLVATKAPLSAVYNVGPQAPTKIRDVVDLVANALGKAFDEICEIAEDREHQDARYWLNSSAITQSVGWSQKVRWSDGISRMVGWGRRYLDQLRDLPTDFTMRG